MEEKEEFKARKPDFRGTGVVVWENHKAEKHWLSIKVDGLDETLVAFKMEE